MHLWLILLRSLSTISLKIGFFVDIYVWIYWHSWRITWGIWHILSHFLILSSILQSWRSWHCIPWFYVLIPSICYRNTSVTFLSLIRRAHWTISLNYFSCWHEKHFILFWFLFFFSGNSGLIIYTRISWYETSIAWNSFSSLFLSCSILIPFLHFHVNFLLKFL
jgi:hypothetical protein